MSTYYSKTDDISFIPLTRAEEKDLFERFYAGSLEARNNIVFRHLKLVAKLSLRFAKGGLEDDEAISAGNSALMKALESKCFDPNRGVLFSSYLRDYVRGAISEAIRFRSWRGNCQETSPTFLAGPQLSGNTVTGRFSSEDQGSHYVFSGTNTKEGGSFKSFLETEKAEFVISTTTDDELTLNSAYEHVQAAMQRLTASERAMVRGVFLRGMNLAEVGRECGYTREGARKVRNRALAKLKKALKKIKSELC